MTDRPNNKEKKGIHAKQVVESLGEAGKNISLQIPTENINSGEPDISQSSTSNNYSSSGKKEESTPVKQILPRQRSNSIPGSTGTMVPIALTNGTRVIIYGTENVFQRVPQLVGKIGFIKEAPVHPATWFKVEFPDRRIVTFRPSALIPVDENDKPLAIAAKGSHQKANHERTHESLRGKHNSLKSGQKSNPPPAVIQGPRVTGTHKKSKLNTTLNQTDPETWVGRSVLIIGGRYDGIYGTVFSSGNGWVQVQTPGGEVAKRAYELEIVSGGSSSTAQDSATSEYSSVSGPGRNKRQRNIPSTTGNTRPSKPDSGESTDKFVAWDGASRYRQSTAGLEGAHWLTQTTDVNNNITTTNRRPRAYTDSVMCSTTGGHQRRGMTGLEAMTSAACSNTPREMLFTTSVKSMKAPTPMKSTSIITAKRNFITKYVARMKSKLAPGRPNLTSWKERVNPCLFRDVDYEVQRARSTWMDDDGEMLPHEAITGCRGCGLEHWPSAKFCWNEECSLSPVYWKLSGASAPGNTVVFKEKNTTEEFSCLSLEERLTGKKKSNIVAKKTKTSKEKEKPSKVYESPPSFKSLRFVEPATNPVVDFLLQAPAKIVGFGRKPGTTSSPSETDTSVVTNSKQHTANVKAINVNPARSEADIELATLLTRFPGGSGEVMTVLSSPKKPTILSTINGETRTVGNFHSLDEGNTMENEAVESAVKERSDSLVSTVTDMEEYSPLLQPVVAPTGSVSPHPLLNQHPYQSNPVWY